MKTLKVVMAGLMMIATIGMFSSCENNAKEEPEKTLAEKIQGKWLAEKATWEDGEVEIFPEPDGRTIGIEFKNNDLYVHEIKNGKIVYSEDVIRTEDLEEKKLLNYFFPDDEMKVEQVTVEPGKCENIILKEYHENELNVTYSFQRGAFSK